MKGEMKMSLLKKHVKSKIRWEQSDLKVFNPTNEQMISIKDIIKKNSNVDLTNGEVKSEYSLEIVRYLIKELTNIGNEIDEVSDDELEFILDNGDRDLVLLVKELIKILKEITEDIIDEQLFQLDYFNRIATAIKLGKGIDDMKENYNNVFKDLGSDLTFDDLLEKQQQEQFLPLAKKDN